MFREDQALKITANIFNRIVCRMRAGKRREGCQSELKLKKKNRSVCIEEMVVNELNVRSVQRSVPTHVFQVMLLEYDGITFMLMTHEELVGGKVLTTVYHVKEFRRKIHPHEKSFAFRFELYNSSLIPLKRFSDERGTRHAFRQFKERERGREPGFAVVEYNNETRASTLYFLEVTYKIFLFGSP